MQWTAVHYWYSSSGEKHSNQEEMLKLNDTVAQIYMNKDMLYEICYQHLWFGWHDVIDCMIWTLFCYDI